jgi:16S rRNA G966 N2-methylase RsmD
VIRADVRRALARFEHGFDIVFLDPPYDFEHGDLDAHVRAAGAPEVARPGGLLILTRPAKGYMPVIPVDWASDRRLSYGDARIFAYRT